MKTEKVLLQGNEAVVEGALLAGVRFFAGYPITPSSEIAEGFSRRLPLVGGKFIQMEDELGAMAATIGGSLAGLKSITATSGPGFSLKQENLGFGIMIEAPCVVVNVSRTGPSTGLPTSPSQGDIMQTRWGTHGDHPAVVLAPSTVSNTVDLTIKAFNFSEMLRTPVILMLDEVVGHMRENVLLPAADAIEIIDRKRPDGNKANFKPYEVKGHDHVPPMPDYGQGYHYHTTGLYHDETGFPRGKSEDAEKLMLRLMHKVDYYRDEITLVEKKYLSDAKIAVLAYGSVARSAESAVEMARNNGIKVGFMQIKTVWPFPEKEVAELAQKVDKIIVPELNYGQYVREVTRAAGGMAEVIPLNRFAGQLISPATIKEMIEEED